MDSLPALTDPQRSRLWAEFKQLDHKRRARQIGWNECIRGAYLACVREGLPHESAVAIVVRWGRQRQLKWLPTHQPIRRRTPGPRGGVVLGVEWQPIPEAEQRAEIAELVADLVYKGKRTRPAVKQAKRYPNRAKYLREQMAKRKLSNRDLTEYGGPDHKTTQKALQGLAVRGDVLHRIADALSAVPGHAKVDVLDIPQD